MGLSSLPGVIMVAAATVLLALVVFNVPMLKSLYFFEANFQDYNLRLGTLGYCLTIKGSESCVGPQIGYEMDLNKLFNLSSKFSIPSFIGKGISYTFVLHIVGLALGGVGLIVGLIDMIPGFNLICFPTCLASICGAVTLVALILDLIIFFLLKAGVNKVSGAQGNVGVAVWLTLAAWLCACFAGCAYGLGRCCCCGDGNNRRDRNRKRDRDLDDYRRDDDMRLMALRDEQRRQKEQGLPAFPEMERMPLTATAERHQDKYLYDEPGDHIPGVGAGYGRREPAPVPMQSPPMHTPQDQYHAGYDYGMGNQPPYQGGPPANAHAQAHPGYDASIVTAGAAGVGAGATGVEQTGRTYGSYDDYGQNQQSQGYGQQQQGYGYDQYGHDQNQYGGPNYQNQNYQDPYAQPQHQQNNYDPYYNHQENATYPPAAAGAAGAAGVAAGAATLGAQRSASRGHPANAGPDYYPPNNNIPSTYTTMSSESNYASTNNHNIHAAYEDDGLGAIGRAVTSPTEAQYPAGAPGNATTFMSTDGAYSNMSGRAPIKSPPPAQPQLQVHQPRPQHLATHVSNAAAAELLATGTAPSEYHSEAHFAQSASPPPDQPPSYGQAASGSQFRPMEKGRPM